MFAILSDPASVSTRFLPRLLLLCCLRHLTNSSFPPCSCLLATHACCWSFCGCDRCCRRNLLRADESQKIPNPEHRIAKPQALKARTVSLRTDPEAESRTLPTRIPPPPPPSPPPNLKPWHPKSTSPGYIRLDHMR